MTNFAKEMPQIREADMKIFSCLGNRNTLIEI